MVGPSILISIIRVLNTQQLDRFPANDVSSIGATGKHQVHSIMEWTQRVFVWL